ncbi:hypothetical protein OsJ_08087 [Oryza sativa Japonica Group]|uniref:Uncharacterized protein n=1 Tax=Oryza sativa subsp. japonica TaxID=39947 RepID=B9F212_ORYSJ|nr:hypothetical protein OsJ_08087 [Oryza sativa Japonica Group]
MGWPRAWLLARGFRGFRSRRPLEVTFVFADATDVKEPFVA